MLAIGPAWLSGCVSRFLENELSPQPLRSLDPEAGTGSLTKAEMEDLVAFGEVVVEGRTVARAERECIVEFIEDQTRSSPEYLSLCKTAASIFDRVAGRRFSSLDIHERLDLIARHGLAGWPGRLEMDPAPEILSFRRRLVPDLIRAYYASPAGWADVGYESFPGRCGSLTRYTRPDA